MAVCVGLGQADLQSEIKKISSRSRFVDVVVVFYIVRGPIDWLCTLVVLTVSSYSHESH